jgi:hypothetical protein
VELWEENTLVTFSFNFLFKERFLQAEVVLLAKEASHATVVILDQTDWGAFGWHPSNVKAAFLQCLLKAFCFTSLCYHDLWLPTEFSIKVVHWNNHSLLFSLLSPI